MDGIADSLQLDCTVFTIPFYSVLFVKFAYACTVCKCSLFGVFHILNKKISNNSDSVIASSHTCMRTLKVREACLSFQLDLPVWLNVLMEFICISVACLWLTVTGYDVMSFVFTLKPSGDVSLKQVNSVTYDWKEDVRL